MNDLASWSAQLGFSTIGVTGVDLSSAEPGLRAWLAEGFHGQMHYMAAHGMKRARPAELVPGTVSVISVALPYIPTAWPEDWTQREWERLRTPGQAVISVYARGRDYHRVVRQRLEQLAQRLASRIGPFGYRAFADSAPVMEVELATRAGLGWRGKNTLTLHRDAGSFFFLGELFTDVALPAQAVSSEPGAHCGSCSACLSVCPTGAIVAPYRLDARRCISYLTIEHDGPIDVQWRALMGQRVYGCDDCQSVCPWNRHATRSALPDFEERNGLGSCDLLTLWAWTEQDFNQRLQGSPIRRIGWQRWRRNLAVAMGNACAATTDSQLLGALRQALQAARPQADALVGEHIDWALTRGPSTQETAHQCQTGRQDGQRQ